MKPLALMLALYVVYVWAAWFRRGFRAAFLVAAAAISGLILWNAWSSWLAADSPTSASAVLPALFGWAMAFVLASILRRPLKPFVQLLTLWIATTILGSIKEIVFLGDRASEAMREYPSIAVLLALKVAAFANLAFIVFFRKELLEEMPARPCKSAG